MECRSVGVLRLRDLHPRTGLKLLSKQQDHRKQTSFEVVHRLLMYFLLSFASLRHWPTYLKGVIWGDLSAIVWGYEKEEEVCFA